MKIPTNDLNYMTKFLFHIFYFLSITFLFSECHEDPQEFSVPQELKEWGYFKPGSYWIYQRDDSTAIIDCVYVSYVQIRHDSVYDDNILVRIKEKNIIKMNASSGNYLDVELRSGEFNTLFVYDYNKVFDRINGYFLIGVNSSNQLIENPPFYQYENKYNDFVINNISYSNVIYLKKNNLWTDDQTNDTLNEEFWIAKNKWIIKKIINDSKFGNQQWSLLRSNIIQ